MSITKNQEAKEYGQQLGNSKGKETLPSLRNDSAPVSSMGFGANHTAITESWPTSHKLRCVDGGNSEGIASDVSRVEKGEDIDGNDSNKERSGRCVISEAEQGATLDVVLMDVDPFRLSKGGNPNFLSDHKAPSEPEFSENLVKPPSPTVTNTADPKRVFHANVYGGDSGEQDSFVQGAAYSQGFMEVEPVSGYPIPTRLGMLVNLQRNNWSGMHHLGAGAALSVIKACLASPTLSLGERERMLTCLISCPRREVIHLFGIIASLGCKPYK
ncbi:hypothetical protein U1Q18_037040 [Sarracenia purpurea var. burkii]